MCIDTNISYHREDGANHAFYKGIHPFVLSSESVKLDAPEWTLKAKPTIIVQNLCALKTAFVSPFLHCEECFMYDIYKSPIDTGRTCLRGNCKYWDTFIQRSKAKGVLSWTWTYHIEGFNSIIHGDIYILLTGLLVR